HLGGGAPLRTAVGKFDTHAHETLRRLGQRHHAEPEWHSQVDVSLEEADLAHAEQGGRHAIAVRFRRRAFRTIASRSVDNCPDGYDKRQSCSAPPGLASPTALVGDFRPSIICSRRSNQIVKIDANLRAAPKGSQ